MSLAYDKYCLTELDPPLVLQEFVNHGGVLFKVYIVGDQIRVVRRFSLPDVQEGKDACSGAIPFPRVSNAAATAEEADLDPQAAGKETLFTCFLGSHLCIGSVLVWSNRVR
jgi:inositol-1,3,4-trisphosphate 5/6-kinase/inositol-tetrakisphosphate 1-kinase